MNMIMTAFQLMSLTSKARIQPIVRKIKTRKIKPVPILKPTGLH